RVEIRVVDAAGDGVGEARVTIHAAGNGANQPGTPLLDVSTGTDGRTLFLTGMDGPGGIESFQVAVQPADGSAAVTETLSLEQTPWVITLPQTEARLPAHLDLALVIDTTGSMGDELGYLKAEIDSIAAEVHRRFPNVKQRYALILYRDEGDQYVTRLHDFTESLDEFRDRLAEQSAGGGGDYPEAVHLALERSEKLSWRETDTARVMFLIGDAPPHSPHAPRLLDSAKRLRLSGVTIFPIAASGAADEFEYLARTASFLTMGQYLFLTDHSGVGNAHAKPTAPKYNVERLDQLMFRMIASELSGEPFEPRDILATEEGDPNAPQPPPAPQQGQEGAALPRVHFQPVAVVQRELTGEPPSWFTSGNFFRWGIAAAALAMLLVLDRKC
ncbi:MAG: vWA domain-containing protein, partial [Planctomycetaceae bacterium]